MKPPYQITANILKLVASISTKIGEVNAKYIVHSSTSLRKQNQIKTIHSSLKIEGNTLSEQQITALIDDKRVLGPEKDIKEVLNAIEVYKKLNNWKPNSEKHFLNAHQLLLAELVKKPGNYRTEGVGIMKGSKVAHIAPPFQNVPHLMKELFKYLNDKEELALVKSCVFHYEMEFIHPFLDGNGRMGRLWQTLILMEEYPVFEFLPFETLISKNQNNYYKALAKSDNDGSSTPFIEYMLSIIDESLSELLLTSTHKLNAEQRLNIFLSENQTWFSRADYMKKYNEISTATASRDLKMGVDNSLIEKEGDKKTSIYRIKID